LPALIQEFIPGIEKFKKEHHPFMDGNGRTARLLMNLILLQLGYNVAIIPLITRREYIDALELAHTNDHEFVHFIARMVWETQNDYLRLFLK
jgi:Fic family protein